MSTGAKNMPEQLIETLKVTPLLDLELLLLNSEMTSLEGKVVDSLMERWAAWMPSLHTRRILLDNKAYLAIWLDAVVEQEVDKAFAASPSEGFLLNSLAQTLCMSAVHDVLPLVAKTGCAPLPEFTETLQAVLEQEELCKPVTAKRSKKQQLTLARRYAVLTNFSFGSSCTECSLEEDCPGHRTEEE
jgi:hypothetical protein